MGIKLRQVPKTYNATPRRIQGLAKHITHHLLAVQAMRQAKGWEMRIKESDIVNALESFVDPRNYHGI